MIHGDDEDDDDPDLFAYARHTDPDTSHDAAESLDEADVTKREQIVCDAIRSQGDRGATWDDITKITGLRPGTISPRFKPLRKKKRIEWRKDERGKKIKRTGTSNCAQTVWFAYTGQNDDEETPASIDIP